MPTLCKFKAEAVDILHVSAGYFLHMVCESLIFFFRSRIIRTVAIWGPSKGVSFGDDPFHAPRYERGNVH